MSSKSPAMRDDGWGMSPAMRALSISNGWDSTGPRPGSPAIRVGSPAIKGADVWRSATPFIPSTKNDDEDEDSPWATSTASACKAWMMGDACGGWCGSDHPPASLEELFFPTHASVADICEALGSSAKTAKASGNLKQTPDDKEKQNILHQSHVDFMVPALSVKKIKDENYTDAEVAKMRKHLKDLLVKLEFKP